MQYRHATETDTDTHTDTDTDTHQLYKHLELPINYRKSFYY